MLPINILRTYHKIPAQMAVYPAKQPARKQSRTRVTVRASMLGFEEKPTVNPQVKYILDIDAWQQ